jgi:hypothetical protein
MGRSAQCNRGAAIRLVLQPLYDLCGITVHVTRSLRERIAINGAPARMQRPAITGSHDENTTS